MTRSFVIPKRLVWEAVQKVKASGGNGVEGKSIEVFEDKLGNNLHKFWSPMESGRYFSPPVKAVPISKKSGSDAGARHLRAARDSFAMGVP